MGACVSVNKNPDSAMKVGLSFGSKTEKLVTPSPIKDKPIITDDRPIAEVGLKSQWSSSQPVTTFCDFGGSKEESFFDSQPWLESDCDDDFLSVNGDFTPSRGSTPVHHSFSVGKPTINTTQSEDRALNSEPEPSPTDKKKKLVELFRDSLRIDQDFDVQNLFAANGKVEGKTTTLDLPLKSENGTPYYISGGASVCSSERTPNGNLGVQREKSIRSMQCCLPSLVSWRSFSERKKKRSPARSI